MRRAALLAQLARSAQQCSSATSSAQVAAPAAVAARFFAAGATPPPATPPGEQTPLQKFMPMFIAAFPAAYNAAKGAATDLATGLLTSNATKSTVTSVADTLLVSENFLNLQDVDLAKWACWLAAAGYSNRAGWQKIAEAARGQVGNMSPADAAALAEALYSVEMYDKQLFASIADLVKARFMDFETPALLKLVPAFADNDAYEEGLFDDIADGITYCNHVFAPHKCSVQDISAVFKVYAKYGHDRADLFVHLARAIQEFRVQELPDKQMAATVMDLLRSFDRFSFWPDVTEGLFVVADQRAAAFSEADKAYIAGIVTKVEELQGGLPYYRGGYKDPEHSNLPGWGSYNLYVMRDELVPQYYKPSDIRVLKN